MNMSMQNMPLRYNISSWMQLPSCQSNSSLDLKLEVSNIIHDARLSGTLIKVVHKTFGVLFAYLVDGGGNMLSTGANDTIPELTTNQILTELRKYGFYITYNPEAHLNGEQLDYLMTLDKLGFQKIRLIAVREYQQDGRVDVRPTVVAFNIEQNSDWINNGYSPSLSEFLAAVGNGSAVNVSGISAERKFRWDWLTYVANIKDIIKDNA